MQQQSNNNLTLTTLVVSLGGLLFGFDMAVVSGILPFVQKQFGLSSVQEGWFVSSALAGCIVGVIFASDISDRLGRKKLLALSALLFLVSAVGCTFLSSFSWLIAARILAGMAVGIASSVVPLYLSEIAPANKRGRLVTFYQLAVTIGIFVAYGSNILLLKYAPAPSQHTTGTWVDFIYNMDVWRKMFGVGTLPAIMFLFGILWIPESPRWLKQKADRSAITAPEESGYRQLFAPQYRRALLIGILLPLFSQFSGINAIIYYGPTILHNAGITLDNSLLSQLFFGAANVFFTFFAIWKVDSLGRRPLYLWGTSGAMISLIFTGLCFYNGATNGIYLLLCVLAFLAFFAFSIGPLKFVIAAEIFPDSIRAKALSLSIMVMWVADAIVGQLTPMLLHSIGTAQTFWFFALFCLLAFITVYKLIPETKGQTLEQIQNNWKNIMH
ncbi:SP family arabinose:H+ symporter-like MFS transporter [Chitinophaga niastensis]|uniref:SP family arabinose:H+ symporter-like MFS transporter n=1 Tax=Chitinophaga niastensis TaxID=536980 RepID=A0A2P8HHK4_CHINA|nr:MFS transporter [Chitinophaga niastensis]PSL45660.1 SP family arabinose:H+ symporter-like MFS transporter [Chitinophaga niastensis]